MTRPTLDLRETPEDLAVLQNELRDNEDCWLLDTSRQDKIACQRDTQTILLRIAVPALAAKTPSSSVHPSRDSKVSSRFPRTMEWLTHFANQLEGELGRAMLVRLKPHGQIYRHIDRGDYYRVRHRFHVMLYSPDGCWLECDDERWPTRTGQIVWFDNKCPYEEGNPSDEWSVRLIVDILPKPRPPIPSPYQNFALLKSGVDVGPLLEELDRQPELWDVDTRRQTNIRVQRETSSIPLRSAMTPIPEGVNQIHWHPSRRTPHADRFPRIYAWAEAYAREVGGDLARLSVVRLNPHGTVYPHIDEGDYYTVRDRYHLVLRSPGGSAMNSGDEAVVFRDGELWWFNNKAVHDAHNPSAEGRIHLIFDILPPRPTAFWNEYEADPSAPLVPDLSSSLAVAPMEDVGTSDASPRTKAGTLESLAAAVRAMLAGKTLEVGGASSFLPEGAGIVQVELRASGRLVGRGWARRADYCDGLRLALRSLREQPGMMAANELMLSLGGASRELPLADRETWERLDHKRWRGLFGYEVRLASDPAAVVMISPFDFVATNRSFVKLFANAIAIWGLTLDAARTGAVTLSEFETERFRIEFGREDAPLVPLVRGRRLVALEEVSLASVASLQRILGDYLVRSTQADGRMMYLYHPSRGSEDRTRDNSIRQWMASRALIRVWQQRGSEALLEVVRKNLENNLKTMYAEEGELGLIVENGKVKLGALALAALALGESPFAAEFATVRHRLSTTIDVLWRQDGSFRTFYRPAERDDCQNFYPGEALLFWATRVAARREPALLERFHQSFTYYRAWHLENRNPAFIPWHTQAYRIVWDLTRDVELASAVFLMNDWLLDVQQWESAPHPDCQGRFYDPNRPFGPPHASSTAVYLEGLADAFALARILGEHERVSRYRIAIVRGLRSLLQLTFKDEVDMFYIAKREAVRGGMQTSEYDNSVRVDNVQHALAAIGKIFTVFAAEDYCV